MLSLRFARSGRRNLAFFRVVLTEKSKPCDSGYIKILGWYNPRTKEVSLEKEAILSWIDKGAITSNSVAKLLIAQGVKHKNIKFVQDAPKTKKDKKGEKKPKSEVEVKAETSDAEEVKEEKPVEEKKESEVAPESLAEPDKAEEKK